MYIEDIRMSLLDKLRASAILSPRREVSTTYANSDGATIYMIEQKLRPN